MKRSIALNVIQKPNTSLRVAFWSLITTSGIFWILALLLGSGLLSSCSGSIFTEAKKPSTPTAPHAPTPPQNQIIVIEKKPDPTPEVATQTKPRGKNVVSLETLEVFELLAPAKVAEWTENLNEKDKYELLSHLILDIEIGKANKEDDKIVREIAFFIKYKGVNVYRGNKKDSPYISANMIVSKDQNEGNTRSFFANGYLQGRDDATEAAPFVALSLKFVKDKNFGFVLSAGNFIEYLDGDPQPGYQLNNNELIRIRFK